MDGHDQAGQLAVVHRPSLQLSAFLDLYLLSRWQRTTVLELLILPYLLV
jgi:hypothetical protein